MYKQMARVYYSVIFVSAWGRQIVKITLV